MSVRYQQRRLSEDFAKSTIAKDSGQRRSSLFSSAFHVDSSPPPPQGMHLYYTRGVHKVADSIRNQRLELLLCQPKEKSSNKNKPGRCGGSHGLTEESHLSTPAKRTDRTN
ncbi:hypothetical protein RvY_07647 [Ramazzottius varieornatus]|uniref:Uncharacterized protein n=1 Tax=Ramazzottius varieornatus TaxID=947166 RepID=A0A1D1V362_RAMVA|nr:hypothetical protein RvY_07647 [Ramazzottius varieornatus]